MEYDGAAKRRRERRLRSWVKHERQTVAMALAKALHHTEDCQGRSPRRETEHELYAAPRRPKPPSPGCRHWPRRSWLVRRRRCWTPPPSPSSHRLSWRRRRRPRWRRKSGRGGRGGRRRSACWRSTGGSATICRSLLPSTRLGRSGPVALRPLLGRGGRGKRRGTRRLLKPLPLVAALVVDRGSGTLSMLVIVLSVFFTLWSLRLSSCL